jgi:hypothetical protein
MWGFTVPIEMGLFTSSRHVPNHLFLEKARL